MSTSVQVIAIMEEKSTTTSQICRDVLVQEVPKDELQKLYRSADIPPEPRQLSFHECWDSEDDNLVPKHVAVCT
jgi:hypothetical protein